jgi:hypothetical protein
MSADTPAAAVALTDDELELVVVVLANHTLECGRLIAAKARDAGAPSAANALRELVAASALARRLSLELTGRSGQAPPASTLAELVTCAECGARGDKHESDCDMRPVQP